MPDYKPASFSSVTQQQATKDEKVFNFVDFLFYFLTLLL